MRCCCQISTAENYIVLMWCKTNWTKSYEKKKNVTVGLYFHAFSSKANFFESPLKTYLVIDNVKDVIVNMPKVVNNKKKGL